MRRQVGIGIIVLGAFLGAASAQALAVQAGDDKAAVARGDGQRAGESWLAVVDQGKYGTSWEAAAALFRQSVGREAWVASLRDKRQPLGAVQTRSLQTADYSTSLPGVPEGRYVTLRFATSFEKQGSLVETLVLAPEAGTWRVLGYHVTPATLSNEQVEAFRTEARKAALAWLAVLDGRDRGDRGAYGKAWDVAAATSRQAVPREKWVSALEQARSPLGSVKSRTFQSTEYSTSVPGAPPGEYVTVRFDTVFETHGPAVETLTLRLESGLESGRWRVAGYFFQ